MTNGAFLMRSGTRCGCFFPNQKISTPWAATAHACRTGTQWTQSCLCYEQDANGMRLTEPTFVVILLLIAALLNGLKQGYLLISGGKASSNTMSSRELIGHGFLWMVR